MPDASTLVNAPSLVAPILVSKPYAMAIAALPLGLVGIAVGKIFTTLIDAIARNPGVRDKVFTIGILGFALTEAVALFILLIVFLIYGL